MRTEESATVCHQNVSGEISDGILVLHGEQLMGYGPWAVHIQGVVPPGASFRLSEALVIKGFDLPAGGRPYGNIIYVRNVTPVIHRVTAVATLEWPSQAPPQDPPKAKK